MISCECNEKSCVKSNSHGEKRKPCAFAPVQVAETLDEGMGWLVCNDCRFTYIEKGWTIREIRWPVWDQDEKQWVYSAARGKIRA